MSTPLPKDPRDWPLERKLEYAMDRAEKLIDRLPEIADIWLKETDRLTGLVASRSPTTGQKYRESEQDFG